MLPGTDDNPGDSHHHHQQQKVVGVTNDETSHQKYGHNIDFFCKDIHLLRILWDILSEHLCHRWHQTTLWIIQVFTEQDHKFSPRYSRRVIVSRTEAGPGMNILSCSPGWSSSLGPRRGNRTMRWRKQRTVGLLAGYSKGCWVKCCPLGWAEVFVYVVLKTNTGGQISCQGINVSRCK